MRPVSGANERAPAVAPARSAAGRGCNGRGRGDRSLLVPFDADRHAGQRNVRRPAVPAGARCDAKPRPYTPSRAAWRGSAYRGDHLDAAQCLRERARSRVRSGAIHRCAARPKDRGRPKPARSRRFSKDDPPARSAKRAPPRGTIRMKSARRFGRWLSLGLIAACDRPRRRGPDNLGGPDSPVSRVSMAAGRIPLGTRGMCRRTRYAGRIRVRVASPYTQQCGSPLSFYALPFRKRSMIARPSPHSGTARA